MEGTEECNKQTDQTDHKIKISLDEQLKHLTSDFKGQCKVLDASGRFSKTVKLNPENYDLVINFQLTGKLVFFIFNPNTCRHLDIFSYFSK